MKTADMAETSPTRQGNRQTKRMSRAVGLKNFWIITRSLGRGVLIEVEDPTSSTEGGRICAEGGTLSRGGGGDDRHGVATIAPSAIFEPTVAKTKLVAKTQTISRGFHRVADLVPKKSVIITAHEIITAATR